MIQYYRPKTTNYNTIFEMSSFITGSQFEQAKKRQHFSELMNAQNLNGFDQLFREFSLNILVSFHINFKNIF